MQFDLRALLPLVLPFVLFWFASVFCVFAGLPLTQELRGFIAFMSLFLGVFAGLFIYIEGPKDHWAVIDLRKFWDWIMGDGQ